MKHLSKDWEDIIISSIKELEKEAWGKIKVKVPEKTTTLEAEETKLAVMQETLNSAQAQYDLQLELVEEIKAL